MRQEDLTVEVRDINLVRVGVIRPEELDLRMEDRFNNVGVWKLTLANEHPMVPHLKLPGAGIIVTGPNGVLLSGPTTKPEFQATPEDPEGSITFEGVTDTVILADALSWPQPSNSNVSTQTEAHDVRTGNAEALMHAYVNANIGPSASVARKNANLVMGTNGNRGPTLTKRPRFPVLGNLLTDIAVTANLGFKVIQDGDDLEFQTYEITDRSAYIRLDVANDTLAGSRLAVSAPTATHVVVAGQGEQEERTFRMVTTTESVDASADWGRRIERFLDQRQTNEADELDQAGLEVLAEEGFTAVAVQAVPVDDAEGTMRYGIDWGLGDLVTVVIGDTEYVSPVTGTLFQISPEGFKVGVVLGDGTKFDSDAALRGRVSDTARRVGELERNMETTADLAAVVEDVQADVAALDTRLDAVESDIADMALSITTDSLQLDSSTEVTLSSTGHALQIGATGSTNIAADSNEIQARTNGAATSLHLNPHGGEVHVGNEGTNVGVVRVGQSAGLNVHTNINQIQAFNNGAASQLHINYSNSGPIALGNNSVVTVAGTAGRLIIENSSQDASPSSTGHPFQVGATTGQNVRIDQNEIVAANNGAASGLSICNDGGNVQMGANLQVSGTLFVAGHATGSLTANANLTSGGELRRNTSSRRYKENIQDWSRLTSDKILSLNPRTFQRNDERLQVPIPRTGQSWTEWESVPVPLTEESPWYVGYIAEEASDLGLDEFVIYEGSGESRQIDSFAYTEFAAVAHQIVLREQQARIDELTAKNADLEARLARLESLIDP